MPNTELLEYDHGSVHLEGFLVSPEGTERRPAVLIAHEWWGRSDYVEQRAVMLAERGYVGFAADLYGKGVRAKDKTEAGSLFQALMTDRQVVRDRITAALEVLRQHPRVDPDRVVCIGYCMGGTVALELARSGADLRGAVSFHGALATPLPAKKGTIRCPVSVYHGSADPMVGTDQVAQFRTEMTDAGVDWQFHEFGGAVHGFTRWDANDVASGIVYHESSDRRSWAGLCQFLDEAFYHEVSDLPAQPVPRPR